MKKEKTYQSSLKKTATMMKVNPKIKPTNKTSLRKKYVQEEASLTSDLGSQVIQKLATRIKSRIRGV